MSKGHNAVQRVKNDGGIDSFVAIELCKILDLGYPSLVELEVVLFQPQGDLFQYVVDDCQFKFWVKFA